MPTKPTPHPPLASHLAPDGPALIDFRTTMSLLGLRSRNTIYDLLNAGRLEGVKIFGKSLIIRESVERLLREAPRIGRPAA